MVSETHSGRVVLTYDYLARLPDDGKRYELFSGEAYVTPAPTVMHQRISRNLEFVLHRHVEENSLGEILNAPVDLILAQTSVLQPDLLFVAKDRAHIVTERGVEGPADLVVEILSDSTSDRDRGIKKQLYARFGVQNYWIVDPTEQTLVELTLAGGEYKVHATHSAPDTFVPDLFPGLSIDLAAVFPAAAPAAV